MPAQLKLYTHTSLHQYLEDWWLRLPNLNKHKTTNKKQRTLILCLITNWVINVQAKKQKQKQKKHIHKLQR